MYPTGRNFENYGTWYQYVTAVFGEQDLRCGIRLLRLMQAPLTPSEALDLAREWLVLFGPAGPEVTKFTLFFTRHMLGDPGVHREFFAPNLSELGRLRVALMEFEFNRSKPVSSGYPNNADRQLLISYSVPSNLASLLVEK
ncbi:uncharacterized protein LOC123274033 [Cotesia glomerata]|uniref:uncharacterized protein LOC123274033 n=1 Tax=Cotesia glomerata TaxID=32391 RepID=UPI001D029642|nr:uncharacterized protein LOC123274033 [Cotesia glomerata]